jgi:hypothetical protein
MSQDEEGYVEDPFISSLIVAKTRDELTDIQKKDNFISKLEI